MKYLISFSLPRFCDQSLDRSRKERFYRGVDAPWVAKLDTVVHELFHIDPEHKASGVSSASDGTLAAAATARVFRAGRRDGCEYLDSRPDPAIYDFLRHDFNTLDAEHGGVAARASGVSLVSAAFLERLAVQPRARRRDVDVERRAGATPPSPRRYPENDLHMRQFPPKPLGRLVARGGALRPDDEPAPTNRVSQ